MDFPIVDLPPDQIKTESWKHTLLLAFQSLGVVFGNLSIGPLYVYRVAAADGFDSDEMVYGLMSFIFWTFTLVSFVKYIFIILMADDNGEGGTFALYSLVCRHAKAGLLPNNEDDGYLCLYKDSEDSKGKLTIEKIKKRHYFMLFMAMLGSCTIIACGFLVPTISVIIASWDFNKSAEELSSLLARRSVTFAEHMRTPLSCAILTALFVLQHYGTHKISFLFAPIIIMWLLLISGVGVYNIFHWDHHVISALSPKFMYKFIINIDLHKWRSLGGVVLCTAGSEAMFADLGHFSKKSIKVVFILLVYPSLILCYLGQTAYISQNWSVHKDGEDVTFLRQSVPNSVRHVFSWLSLLASIVGSQAAITATFSIIKQCISLSCLPRLKVVHTSSKIHGQVYIPDVNWILMVLCLSLTLATKSVRNIGNAIGLAITLGMLLTNCFMSLIIALYWDKVLLAACFVVFFGCFEAIYFSACVLNTEMGGWTVVVIVEVILVIMLSWHYGVMKKYQFEMQNKVSIDWLTTLGPNLGVSRVPGIGFVCTDITKGIPLFFSHFVTNLPAFHQVLIFVSFKSMLVPKVPPSKQLLIGRMGPKEYKVFRCIVRYGYRDSIEDINEFEDQIIHGIGELMSQDGGISDDVICSSPEDRMVVSGNLHEGNALITVPDTDSVAACASVEDVESRVQSGEQNLLRRKRVRFLLPPESPLMSLAIREELQELLNARESGTTYILGKSHLCVHKGSNFIRSLIIGLYIFLVNNCREASMVLNIPHAAFVEVCVSYIV